MLAMGTTGWCAEVAAIERLGTATAALAMLGQGSRSDWGTGVDDASVVTVERPIVVVVAGTLVGVLTSARCDEPRFGTATSAVTVTTQPKTTVRNGPRRRQYCERGFTGFNVSWS
jgi:hypothetical protein